jgi:hypothetical protein
MNPYFQLLFSLFIRSLGLSDPKLKLKRFFLFGWNIDGFEM